MVKNKLDDLQIKNILSKMKIIGLVGASDNPEKPSNIVMRYLQTKGYKAVSYTHLTLPTTLVV